MPVPAHPSWSHSPTAPRRDQRTPAACTCDLPTPIPPPYTDAATPGCWSRHTHSPQPDGASLAVQSIRMTISSALMLVYHLSVVPLLHRVLAVWGLLSSNYIQGVAMRD